jgi:hypothetical protein
MLNNRNYLIHFIKVHRLFTHFINISVDVIITIY